MSFTLTIDESNGAGETQTADVSNINFGSQDAPNLAIATNPVVAGQNSFEKWLRLHISDMGSCLRVSNIRIWRTGSLAANTAVKTNVRTTSYDGAQTYAQPSQTDRSATYKYSQDLPSSEPASANLGIGGSLSGALTGVGYSDYWIMQAQSTVDAVAGSTFTITAEYDRVD